MIMRKNLRHRRGVSRYFPRQRFVFRRHRVNFSAMRTTIFVFVIGAAFAPLARAGTAVDAIHLLPASQAKNLALIEGRDGAPDPERWYLLVLDPAAENGFRQFVVAGGELKGSSAISQFAENLKTQDVVGADAVKVDSDRLTLLARQFALANNATIGRINYELKKSDAGAVWKLSFSDESGASTAELTVSAGKGDVLSHEGFAHVPARSDERKVAKALATEEKKSDDAQRNADGSEKHKNPGAAIGRSISKLFGGGKKDEN
jgi:hypothetical protein